MAINERVSAEIQQECEYWRGVTSIPRVMELRALGIKMSFIAERFGVTRQAVYDAMKLAKENAPTSGKDSGRDQTQENTGVSPLQDTSGETTTNGGTQ